MVAKIDRPVAHAQSKQIHPAVSEKLKDPAWAWSAYKPDTQRPWTLAQAGHLYRRAAFGATWDQLQQALSDGPKLTIYKLLLPQDFIKAFNRTYDEYETSAAGSTDSLKAWWLRRMILTPHPLLEKMTLFWHSHFAINNAKVKNARLMQKNVHLLRSQALNSFQALLKGISRDPAMLIWLGAEANRKARPNENFARTLMETFTLGPGNFTEKDVQEAARAFTGWFVLMSRLRYIPREHDDNIKQILGQKGNFTGDDVIRIVLEQQATAKMLLRKLYRWLISETEELNAELIAPLAKSFAKDYNIFKLVEKMLRSNLFFSPVAYRRRIKCPVEFALGIIKGLEGVVSTTQLAKSLADIGQNLYHPPTVKGWIGGRHWINSATMVGRHNLALALLQGSGPYGNKLNPRAVARKHGFSTTESTARFLLDLFLQGDLESGVRDTLPKIAKASAGAGGGDLVEPVRRFTHAIVTLPEFQLA
ncbi:MAG: DUF1800 family protein [Phycisphaerae bacterium]|nr:DUF1800 domain-containing protein [Phycisphaerae bacterium]NIP52285.1 DUF1800 domain-containing protein [Phycisphaerae bacterium]NIS51249.1 DUF1800 domain-containing protein [Phycisphaerae bacterium]NIU11751.1 DUF1800 domain-containing protein [Phycisphaerae bacterium]NIU56530.1 DUF1800 family protein [Phycisphaerae bacterium]